ncbi:MAG TPA: ABC transporter substrate-binding protein [candidate division Zixibacteria bacterium]|nr:ABC transporter substrate-binding protein [candidate division Zixibacteria bacterium]
MKRTRGRIGSLALAFSVSGVFFLGRGEPGAAESGLTQSYYASSITSESVAALWVAKDRDLFRKYGLESRFILMPRSAVTVAALLAREIDVAIIGPGHLLNAASGAADVVGIANLVQRLNYRFVGRPEVRKPEDLHGKRVAISGPGSVSHVVALLSLRKLGIDPNRARISFITIPGTEINRRAALETRQVDASPLNGSVGDMYAAKGYTMLLNLKGSGLILSQTALATTRRTIATRRPVVEAYLKGLIEAIAFVLDPANKPAVLKIIAANLRLDSAAAAEEAYAAVVESYDRVPYPNVDGIKILHEVLASLNPKLQTVRPESVLDASLVADLERSGFVGSVSRGR